MAGRCCVFRVALLFYDVLMSRANIMVAPAPGDLEAAENGGWPTGAG